MFLANFRGGVPRVQMDFFEFFLHKSSSTHRYFKGEYSGAPGAPVFTLFEKWFCPNWNSICRHTTIQTLVDHTGLGRCWIRMGVIAGCQSFLVVETIMGGFPKELSIDTFSPLSQEKQIISKLSPLWWLFSNLWDGIKIHTHRDSLENHSPWL